LAAFEDVRLRILEEAGAAFGRVGVFLLCDAHFSAKQWFTPLGRDGSGDLLHPEYSTIIQHFYSHKGPVKVHDSKIIYTVSIYMSNTSIC
jgi:hypothetical protein